MNKKKICFIAQFPPPLHGLSKAVDTLYSSELKNEFDFEKVDITNNKNFLKNLNLIRKSKADLFYFTISQSKGGNLRDLVILKLLQRQKKKCLIHLHGGYYRQLVDNDLPTWQKKENYKVIRHLSGAIVLGNALKPIFQGMLPDEKIYVVPNCVDDQYLMSDEEFEEKIKTFHDRKIKHVLYLSNFVRAKGYRKVLEMAKFEKNRVDSGGIRKYHFDFAGKFFEKVEEEFFFSFIKGNELKTYVTYHGIVEGNQKKELFQTCDVFVLLTSYRNEGQPISILEAMGNGMVIVSTNYAGIPDIVRNETNGIMCEKDSLNVSSLFNILDSKDFQKIMMSNRRVVNKMYREINYVNELKKFFINC